MSHAGQSFLGTTASESAGRTTEAVTSTTGHGHKIIQSEAQRSPRLSLPGTTQHTCLFITPYRKPHATDSPEESAQDPGAWMQQTVPGSQPRP